MDALRTRREAVPSIMQRQNLSGLFFVVNGKLKDLDLLIVYGCNQNMIIRNIYFSSSELELPYAPKRAPRPPPSLSSP